jgi:prepilin-type N-terminal cleavage/methylation domain-containing protein/prepilin-type processing-associated H-X9-DG protein
VRGAGGFTLIEVLVVVAILALLTAILLPSLSKARQAAQTAVCLANVRTLATGQALYAHSQQGLLITAGEGSYDQQGTWIRLLERFAGRSLVRRCPSDKSPYFDTLYTDPDIAVPAYRLTSYGINSYVSPTHAPLPPEGEEALRHVSQVGRPERVVQFVELAETGRYATADHVHAVDFYKSASPQLTPNRAGIQMPLGRHGGRPDDWSGVINYSFLDGHAEALPLLSVYVDSKRNRFNAWLRANGGKH